tara:strand:+ start:2637 stop:3587 length:951 start_codon:yes stop_codon:yes gene_type:complete
MTKFITKEVNIDDETFEEFYLGLGSLYSLQGKSPSDVSIGKTPLDIYELLILICQNGVKKINKNGIRTKYIRSQSKKTFPPFKDELIQDNLRLRLNAASGEITKQFLSIATGRRVNYVPQIGTLVQHKGSGLGGAHPAGIAWDHGNYGSSAKPVFFFADDNTALDTTEVIAAVSVLLDAGLLPSGRLGMYENRNIIDNMHYDAIHWRNQNKDLFKNKDIHSENFSAKASGWFWWPSPKGGPKEKENFYYSPTILANLEWIKNKRPKNKNIQKIIDLYGEWSEINRSKITTLDNYFEYLEQKENKVGSAFKNMKIIT